MLLYTELDHALSEVISRMKAVSIYIYIYKHVYIISITILIFQKKKLGLF